MDQEPASCPIRINGAPAPQRGKLERMVDGNSHEKNSTAVST
jgi:hypothetical protein